MGVNYKLNFIENQRVFIIFKLKIYKIHNDLL